MTTYGISRYIYRCSGSRIGDQNTTLKTAICSKKQLAHMLGFECVKKTIKNALTQTDIYIRARVRLLARAYARMGEGTAFSLATSVITDVKLRAITGVLPKFGEVRL